MSNAFHATGDLRPSSIEPEKGAESWSTKTTKPAKGKSVETPLETTKLAGSEVGESSSSSTGVTARGHTRELMQGDRKKAVPLARRTYAPTFRGKSVGARELLPDIEVGKYGVVSAACAERLEENFLTRLRSGPSSLDFRDETTRRHVLTALYLYLAINGGSIGNADGFGGLADDTQPLRVGDAEVPLQHIVQIFGSRTYAYMRYRATEIRDALENVFYTLEHTPEPSPALLELAELIRTTAVRRDLTAYPQYIAVGSEYAYQTPDHVAAAVIRSGASIVSTAPNIREDTSRTVLAARTAVGPPPR